MSNILIISPGILPVPAYEGGAVENLVEIFIRSNEASGKFKIVCISPLPRIHKPSFEQLRHSSFVYVNTRSLLFLFKKIIFKLLNLFINKNFGNAYINEVLHMLGNELDKFDGVIIENRPDFILPLRRVFQGCAILHLHNKYLDKRTAENTLITKSFDEIYGVSSYILSQIGAPLAKDKMHVLYNGVEQSDSRKCPITCTSPFSRGSLNISADEFVVLYTGRLAESKGVHLLIKASKVFAQNVSARLILAGASAFKNSDDDPYVIELKALAESEGKRIIFLGYVEYSCISFVYRLADVGVVPSLEPEGFGMTVLEHLAYGNPVITTGLGGISEILDSSVGFIISASPDKFVDQCVSALTLLHANHSIRESMSKFAVERASNFSSDKYVERFSNLLMSSTKASEIL